MVVRSESLSRKGREDRHGKGGDGEASADPDSGRVYGVLPQ